MLLQSMQKSIKEQVNMNLNIFKILLSIFFLLQLGCTAPTRTVVKSKNFLCEEEVNPKSLDYLEQQYRCKR